MITHRIIDFLYLMRVRVEWYPVPVDPLLPYPPPPSQPSEQNRFRKYNIDTIVEFNRSLSKILWLIYFVVDRTTFNEFPWWKKLRKLVLWGGKINQLNYNSIWETGFIQEFHRGFFFATNKRKKIWSIIAMSTKTCIFVYIFMSTNLISEIQQP